MFDTMSDEELVRFDETTRSSRESRDDHSRDSFLDAALSSLHPDGFIREDAIKRLAQQSDGRELRFLLLRVNDWVPQVRNAARKAVIARITPGYAAHFAKHLGLVARLQRSRRVDHAELLRAITQLLATSLSREALVAAMNDQRSETRRIFVRILIDRNAEDRELLRALLRVEDAVIRLLVMRMLPIAENRDVFEALFDDHAGSVRAQALLIAGNAARLRSALLDRNGNVRGVARHGLRDEGIDFAALYRDALHGDRAIGAIAGLSETGTRADAELLAPFLAHPRTVIRRAAIRAVMVLGGEDFIDRVVEMLGDPSRGVSAQARRSLMPHGAMIGADELWAMYASASADHVRRNLLALMTALPKWESITLYVRADARESIDRWNQFFNRRPSVPTARQLEALDDALSQSSLPKDTVAMIRFSMRPFS